VTRCLTTITNWIAFYCYDIIILTLPGPFFPTLSGRHLSYGSRRDYLDLLLTRYPKGWGLSLQKNGALMDLAAITTELWSPEGCTDFQVSCVFARKKRSSGGVTSTALHFFFPASFYFFCSLISRYEFQGDSWKPRRNEILGFGFFFSFIRASLLHGARVYMGGRRATCDFYAIFPNHFYAPKRKSVRFR
jgi:hypothetical protein